MCKSVYKIFVVGFFVIIATTAWAGRVNVSARIDSLVLMIGEQATVSIEAVQPEDRILQFPVFSDTVVSGLELVETLRQDTAVIDGEMIRVRADYVVTAFDSALVYMPGFIVVDGEDSLYTNPLTLKILDMPVDTAQQAITDIKGVYEPPFDWVRLWTIVGCVVLALIFIAAVVYVIIKLYGKKGSGEDYSEEKYVDPRSAYEIAIEELEALRLKKLWQQELYKEYYTELTDVLRRYIGRRYAIGAMELTSEELLSVFKSNRDFRDKKREMSILSDVLGLADLVKFAKWIPLADENDNAFSQVKDFVDLTKEEKKDTIESQE